MKLPGDVHCGVRPSDRRALTLPQSTRRQRIAEWQETKRATLMPDKPSSLPKLHKCAFQTVASKDEWERTLGVSDGGRTKGHGP